VCVVGVEDGFQPIRLRFQAECRAEILFAMIVMSYAKCKELMMLALVPGNLHGKCSHRIRTHIPRQGTSNRMLDFQVNRCFILGALVFVVA